MTSSDEVCGDMLCAFTAETTEARPLNPCTWSRDVRNLIHAFILFWVYIFNFSRLNMYDYIRDRVLHVNHQEISVLKCFYCKFAVN